jgi:uncharacterized low-complexity protein
VKKKEFEMKKSNILSTGALAVAISFGGLSLQANAGPQTDVKADRTDGQIMVKGAEGQCGSSSCGTGNCGTDKPDDEGEE